MDDTPYREFFARPTQPYHRRYEALRAVFLDGRSQKEVAEHFGYQYGTHRQLVSEFRRQNLDAGDDSPFFERPGADAPPRRVPSHTVHKPAEAANDDTPEVADRQQLVLSVAEPLRLRTRVAGVFLFLPLLARLGFDALVRQAGYPGSRMVPADAALLSLLTLKLLDKERRSHIDDFNFEAALGLFAGLNVLPKKSFATDYSYRTQRHQQQKLLAGWVKRLSPLLLPEANAFSLDFHPIPYRGDEAVLENHYIPRPGHGARQRPVVLRPRARQPGALLCQRQPDPRRAAGRGRCGSSSSGTT